MEYKAKLNRDGTEVRCFKCGARLATIIESKHVKGCWTERKALQLPGWTRERGTGVFRLTETAANRARYTPDHQPSHARRFSRAEDRRQGEKPYARIFYLEPGDIMACAGCGQRQEIDPDVLRLGVTYT